MSRSKALSLQSVAGHVVLAPVLPVLLCVAALLPMMSCPPAPQQVTLTVTTLGQGTVSLNPAGGTYASGTTVTLTAAPSQGWLFAGWSGGLTGSQNPASLVMNENKNVNAIFEEPWEPDSFEFDVDVSPDTVMVDEAHLSLLLASDEETHVYEFDAAGAQNAGLTFAAGVPLAIHGIAVRRITSATESGGRIIVETEPVSLNEVITDGVIGWDYGVEFTAEKVRAIEIPGYGKVAVQEDTPIEFELEVGDYTYGIKATLGGEVATFEFTVTKDLGGLAQGKFVAQGEIRRFRSRDAIDFAGGELQDFDHELNGMRGEATLELVVTASGGDAVNFELPVPVFELPFVVGFVPVVLEIKAQFVINASVPVDGSSRVQAQFSYDSNLGISYDGVNVQAGGSLGGITFGEGVHETGASSAVSANFGVGFPRVELSIAGGTVVPWAQTAFLIGGSYTFYPACQTADVLFLGALGFDLTVLDWNLFSGSKTLFQEKLPLLRAGDCPEEKQGDGALESEVLLTGYGADFD